MTEDDLGGALSLGAVVGGTTPVPRAWTMAYRDLANRIETASVGADTPLAVNVVLHVPGEVLKPEFVGARTGRYSAKLRILMVQVAIPEGPLPDDVNAYLLDRIDEALDEAEAFAQRRKIIGGRLENVRSIVSSLRDGRHRID